MRRLCYIHVAKVCFEAGRFAESRIAEICIVLRRSSREIKLFLIEIKDGLTRTYIGVSDVEVKTKFETSNFKRGVKIEAEHFRISNGV